MGYGGLKAADSDIGAGLSSLSYFLVLARDVPKPSYDRRILMSHFDSDCLSSFHALSWLLGACGRNFNNFNGRLAVGFGTAIACLFKARGQLLLRAVIDSQTRLALGLVLFAHIAAEVGERAEPTLVRPCTSKKLASDR